MQLRALGKSGLVVSPIGLGTVKLGRAAGLRLASPAKIPTDDEARALLRTASELGVNLLDTAPAYGDSEARLGKLLASGEAGIGPRDRWVISTKVGEEFDPVSCKSRYDFSAAHIAQSVDRSLASLRTDRVEVLLLHFASSGDLDAQTMTNDSRGTDQTHGVLDAMLAVKRAGKARLVGASVSSPAGAAIAASKLDVVMIALNSAEMGTLDVVRASGAAGAGVMIKKPLASGHADAKASLAMVLKTPGVSCAVVGTTSATHLREAAGVADAVG